jgi:DNA-binding transcriptional regulator GbsR (MarR family)
MNVSSRATGRGGRNRDDRGGAGDRQGRGARQTSDEGEERPAGATGGTPHETAEGTASEHTAERAASERTAPEETASERTASEGAASELAAEQAAARFIERFAAEMAEAGMQRTGARVFAALLASEDASMTSAELGRQLRISPAAVSGAVSYLVQVGMVSREREPGSRRDRYRLHHQLWYETFTNRGPILTRWASVLGEGAEALGRDTPAGMRLAETKAFFEFMRGELGGMLERWKVLRESLDLDD